MRLEQDRCLIPRELSLEYAAPASGLEQDRVDKQALVDRHKGSLQRCYRVTR